MEAGDPVREDVTVAAEVGIMNTLKEEATRQRV